jgi:adenylosuccinate synthase
LPELKICTGYRVGRKRLDVFPDDPHLLAEAEPVLENLEPWKEDISGARSFEELPRAARDYVERVEKLVGAPVRMISVGPDRSQTIRRD